MTRGRGLVWVVSGVACLAIPWFSIGDADARVTREVGCGCEFSDEPMTASELLALPRVIPGPARNARSVTMHVETISVGWSYAGGPKRRPFARVRVLDDLGAPVYDATVTADWSGCFVLDGQTAVTGDLDLDGDGQITDNEKGWAVISSSKTANCMNKQCYFTLTVTDVARSGDTYDAGQNVETSDFAKCNPLLP